MMDFIDQSFPIPEETKVMPGIIEKLAAANERTLEELLQGGGKIEDVIRAVDTNGSEQFCINGRCIPAPIWRIKDGIVEIIRWSYRGGGNNE